MKTLLKVFDREILEHPPVWLMRQAGRYLPEYLTIRKNAGSFLDLCYNPDLATEVTLQPIQRFDFDAAILFSDILVIPDALGVDVRFEAGEGPVVEKLKDLNQFSNVEDYQEQVHQHLAPVYQAVKQIKAALTEDKALIGFCGAPWTVALYMIDEKPAKDAPKARQWAYQFPQQFDTFINFVADISAAYLIRQIENGADVVQIFDSWAGHVPPALFEKAVQKPLLRMCRAVKAAHPQVPIMLFPRKISLAQMDQLITAGQNCFDGLGIDFTADLAAVRDCVVGRVVVQGNLDPAVLLSNPEQVVYHTQEILTTMAKTPGYIFNLGHGILPQTPMDHVQILVETIRKGLIK